MQQTSEKVGLNVLLEFEGADNFEVFVDATPNLINRLMFAVAWYWRVKLIARKDALTGNMVFRVLIKPRLHKQEVMHGTE